MHQRILDSWEGDIQNVQTNAFRRNWSFSTDSKGLLMLVAEYYAVATVEKYLVDTRKIAGRPQFESREHVKKGCVSISYSINFHTFRKEYLSMLVRMPHKVAPEECIIIEFCS